MEEFFWHEKYRPRKVEDCILPAALKSRFQAYVDKQAIPNLLLNGPPGCGKTTVAKAMLEQLGLTYMAINGSLDMNLDLLRNNVAEFASTRSVGRKRKYVLIDEGDGLNHLVQPAMRAFIEQFSSVCGFIFTCNNKGKIMPAMHSRLTTEDFVFPKKEMPDLLKQMIQRTFFILTKEGIEFDKKVIVELFKSRLPYIDMRLVLGDLQSYTNQHGVVDVGVLAITSEASIRELFGLMKAKNFSEIRKWVGTREINDIALFKAVHDLMDEYVDKAFIPALISAINKYDYQSAFCADKQLNMLAFLIEVMLEVDFL